MIEKLCETLAPIQERPISFFMPNTSISIEPLEPSEKPALLESKGIASMGCMGIQTILVERYGHGATNLWTDPDTTKIPWWQGKRRQAQHTRGSFIDLEPDIEPPHMSPRIGEPTTHRLLEIADLYAYVSVQSASLQGGRKHRWWLERLQTINPESLRFDPAPGTTLGANVVPKRPATP